MEINETETSILMTSTEPNIPQPSATDTNMDDNPESQEKSVDNVGGPETDGDGDGDGNGDHNGNGDDNGNGDKDGDEEDDEEAEKEEDGDQGDQKGDGGHRGDDEDGDGDVEMRDATGLSVNRFDLNAQRAIFSFNRINLHQPPLTLEFGKWNNRPMIEKRAKDLFQTMKSQQIKPFQQGTMIPLIIDPLDVDPGCLHTDLGTVDESPMLTLTAHGKERGTLWAAGGRHRFHAVKMAVEEIRVDIAKAKEETAKLEAKGVKHGRGTKKRDERLAELRLGIAAKEKEMDATSTWGVILYDRDKMMARGHELALHISRNQEIKHFAEDDKEGLVMHVRMLRNKLRAGDEDVNDWLRRLAIDSKNSILGQIMNHRETRGYLLTLNDFDPLFNYHRIFSQMWVKDNLHSTGGGVLCLIVDYLANIWRSLLSTNTLDGDSAFTEYVVELGRPEGQRNKDLMIKGRVSWSSLVDTDVVARRHPKYSLFTEAIMLGLGKVTKDISLTELLVGGDGELWSRYCEDVNSLFKSQLLTKSIQDEEGGRVRDAFQRKLDFVFLDHGANHFQRPMPLLTPDMIESLGKVLETISDAHTEFWSWIDPVGQYFTNNLKNPQEAKDISAWGLRCVRANRGDIFERPDDAANDLAHFVLRHIDVFIQFQSDIIEFDVPERPRSHASQVPTTMEEAYSGMKEWVKEMEGLMKSAKNKGELGDWVLDHHSHYDWRRLGSKSGARERERFARIAFVEKQITGKYRKALLTKSLSGAFLRNEVQRLLSSHARSRMVLVDTRTTKPAKQYLFPDGIKIKVVGKPVVDVSALVSTREMDNKMMKNRQAVVTIIKRLENLPFAVATPDTSLLAPNVADKIEDLKEALLRNIAVLNVMSKEPDRDLIDPLDIKWEDFDYVGIQMNEKPVWTDDGSEAEALEERLRIHDEAVEAEAARLKAIAESEAMAKASKAGKRGRPPARGKKGVEADTSRATKITVKPASKHAPKGKARQEQTPPPPPEPESEIDKTSDVQMESPSSGTIIPGPSAADPAPPGPDFLTPKPPPTLSQASVCAEPSSSMPESSSPNPPKRSVGDANLSPKAPPAKTRKQTAKLAAVPERDPVDVPMTGVDNLEEERTRSRPFR